MNEGVNNLYSHASLAESDLHTYSYCAKYNVYVLFTQCF